MGTNKARFNLEVAFPGWTSLFPLSLLEYKLWHIGPEFPSKLERTSPDQVHESISRRDGLDPALTVQPLLGALPRMDDGDHEDANEDRNDGSHHVVHSCPHPHPPCRLVIQGRHTWRTGGAATSISLHTPPPTLPSIHSSLSTPPAQQPFHQAPTPLPLTYLIILQLHAIFHICLPLHPMSQSLLHQVSLYCKITFLTHTTLHLPLFCTVTSLSLHSSSHYSPHNDTSLQPSHCTLSVVDVLVSSSDTFTRLIHLSFSCRVC